MPPLDDLLIIADPRADFFEIVQRFRTGASIEVRLDRRRGERRRATESTASEERRTSDRRTRDISEELQTVGWAFIPAAERG